MGIRFRDLKGFNSCFSFKPGKAGGERSYTDGGPSLLRWYFLGSRLGLRQWVPSVAPQVLYLPRYKLVSPGVGLPVTTAPTPSRTRQRLVRSSQKVVVEDATGVG